MMNMVVWCYTPVSESGSDIVTIVTQMVTTSTDPAMIELPKYVS